MIAIAGVAAAALLLVTLVTLEVRHAGPNPGQQRRLTFFGRNVNGKIAVAVIWLLFLLLLLPRVLGLLT